MKEIVKVLLAEGISEEVIHEVLTLLEDIPTQIDKKYPKDTFDDKNKELTANYKAMQQRKEETDKERAIGKRPKIKSSGDLFDIDFSVYDSPEQRAYDKKEEKYDRQKYLKDTSKLSRGEKYTTNKQFPKGTDRATRKVIGKRKGRK